MGKRTTNKRVERDYWPTKDPDAVRPLIPHLPANCNYDEPCAGDGALRMLLDDERGGSCRRASDIQPQGAYIYTIDALDLTDCHSDLFITNPPWTWAILTKIISHLSSIAPTWLLLNADLMHNKRMAPHMKKCVKVVSVGRVSWMNNGKKGFENAAWYLFDQRFTGATVFVGRT